mmetsp:Transcript_23915/g.75485  ORF Transcript_23915/g.75485 Transcript_23915/m.75485 type:complete len:499 (-) Transcript_23915:27-1523(-)
MPCVDEDPTARRGAARAADNGQPVGRHRAQAAPLRGRVVIRAQPRSECARAERRCGGMPPVKTEAGAERSARRIEKLLLAPWPHGRRPVVPAIEVAESSQAQELAIGARRGQQGREEGHCVAVAYAPLQQMPVLARARQVRHVQRQAVATHAVERHGRHGVPAQRAQHAAAADTGRHHHRVDGQRAPRGKLQQRAAALAARPQRHRLVAERELGGAPLQPRGELLREAERADGLVVRPNHTTCKLGFAMPNARLKGDALGGVQHAVARGAVLRLEGRLRLIDQRAQLDGVCEEHEHAAVKARRLQAELRAEEVQVLDRSLRKCVGRLRGLKDASLGLRSREEEAQAEGDHRGVGHRAQGDRDRLIAPHRPPQELGDSRGLGPGVGSHQEGGVSEGALVRDVGLPVHNRHAEAPRHEGLCRGEPDQPSANDRNMRSSLLPKVGRAAGCRVRPCSQAGAACVAAQHASPKMTSDKLGRTVDGAHPPYVRGHPAPKLAVMP